MLLSVRLAAFVIKAAKFLDVDVEEVARTFVFEADYGRPGIRGKRRQDCGDAAIGRPWR